mmetsp:Transcript_23305/g.20191  ORF Transcript_23305/g.20191 Transcript_23305/m.20191 type:complete len:202 (+) Transcript_23305:142-747(+)
MAVTQSAVDKIKDAFLDFVVGRIKDIPFPPFRYENIEFKDISISDPRIRNKDTEANIEEGYINFEANDFEIELKGKCVIDLIVPITQGFRLYTSGSRMGLNVFPGYHNRLHFKVDNVTFHIGSVHLQFDGILGQIETWIINHFSRDLVDTLQKSVSDTVTNSTNSGLDTIVQSTPSQLPVGGDEIHIPDFLIMNYTLVHKP